MDRFAIYKKAGKLGLKPVSYSQFSMFHNCPLNWYRTYVEKIKFDKPSIEMLFGSAFHTVLQEYLTVYFNEGTIKADLLDLNRMLNENMKLEFKNSMKEGMTPFTDKDQMVEFYIDGTSILEFIKENKREYFDRIKYELVEMEYALVVPSDINPKVGIVGFLDIVLRERGTDKYFVRDIKTSFRGWQDNKKKDFSTKSQVLVYKKCLAKDLGVPVENIEVDFFIVKRKLWESEFKQKPVQIFEPSSGKVSMKKFEEEFNKFIGIFDENGKVKDGVIFNKAADKKKCTYCNFKGTEYCTRSTKPITHGNSNNSG